MPLLSARIFKYYIEANNAIRYTPGSLNDVILLNVIIIRSPKRVRNSYIMRMRAFSVPDKEVIEHEKKLMREKRGPGPMVILQKT